MNFKEFLCQILFPRSCAGCKIRLESGVVCEPCLTSVPLHQTLFCAQCDARLPCGKPYCHRNVPYVVGGAGPYHHPVLGELIRELKFKGVREASIPLAALLARYVQTVEPFSQKQWVITPIPLSKQRERERGFNQAEEIARQLATTITMSIDTSLLARTRNTKPQTKTGNIEERRRNLHNCFSAAVEVAGKNILLIDDVITSGTTFREAAQALKRSGAKKIIALAAAKA